MLLRLLSLKQSFFIFLLIFIFFTGTPLIFAQFYDLDVKVGDTILPTGLINVPIPVYMKNPYDTISAFKITLVSSNPDLLTFTGFDNMGTLTSDWEWIGGSNADSQIQILGMANTVAPPNTPGIAPQSGQIPLINLLVATGEYDAGTEEDFIEISFIADVYNFNFVDPEGNSLGISYHDPTIDTAWYNCLAWEFGAPDDSTCLEWEEVEGPPADSMYEYEILNPYLDTSKVKLRSGSVLINPYFFGIGDVNCTGSFNLLDITYLINYLYKGGTAPCSIYGGDMDCNCVVNMMDLTCILGMLYWPGHCTPCTTEQWMESCWSK